MAASTVSTTRHHAAGMVAAGVALLLLMLAACRHDTPATTGLAHLQPLVERCPDSALARLDAIRPEALQPDDQALYYLLLTQARYKLYQPTPPDSLLDASERYFRQQHDLPHLCNALYYRAMTLYESGQQLKAIEKLKEGETLAEALSDDSLQSKYYESLCMVNDMANLNLMMLKYAKKFLNHSISINNPEYIARGYAHVATAYARLGANDSSLTYGMRSIPLMEEIPSTDKAFILANLASDYIKGGNLAVAESLLHRSLAIAPRENTLLMLGKICWRTGRQEEAKRHWDEALKTADEIFRIKTLSELSQAYQADSDYRHAFMAQKEINDLQAALAESSFSEQIAEHQHRQEQQVLKDRTRRYLLRLSMVVIALTAIIVCGCLYHRRRMQSFRSKIDQEQEAIAAYEQKIEMLQASQSKNEKQIAGLQEQIAKSRQNVMLRLGKGQEAYTAVINGSRLPQQDDGENCFIEYYSANCHEQFLRLTAPYQPLSPRLITYLILKDMGKTDKQIEDILCISNAAVRSIKSRVKGKRRQSDVAIQ